MAGLGRALGHVGLAVDHLQVWQAPVIQKLRPRQVALLLEHLEQRHAMIDFGGLQEPFAALAAAPLLQAAKQPHMVARRAPEVPGGDAGRVPLGFVVWPGVPEIDMPAEPVDRLSAYAAETAAAREGVLTIRGRRLPEALWQVGIAALGQT